jgi:tetrahydromethanopterin S-methyltransferase subunit G
MLLILQIAFFALGTYWRRSTKKVQRVIGLILQILSGLMIVLYIIGFALHHHHAGHPSQLP